MNVLKQQRLESVLGQAQRIAQPLEFLYAAQRVHGEPRSETIDFLANGGVRMACQTLRGSTTGTLGVNIFHGYPQKLKFALRHASLVKNIPALVNVASASLSPLQIYKGSV